MNKSLIKYPLITEKGTNISSLGKYLFLVDKKANKSEIKKLIATIYKVEVNDVNIVSAKPKPRRIGRTLGVKPGYKKAIVTLKPGHKLDVLPG